MPGPELALSSHQVVFPSCQGSSIFTSAELVRLLFSLPESLFLTVTERKLGPAILWATISWQSVCDTAGWTPVLKSLLTYIVSLLWELELQGPYLGYSSGHLQFVGLLHLPPKRQQREKGHLSSGGPVQGTDQEEGAGPMYQRPE